MKIACEHGEKRCPRWEKKLKKLPPPPLAPSPARRGSSEFCVALCAEVHARICGVISLYPLQYILASKYQPGTNVQRVCSCLYAPHEAVCMHHTSWGFGCSAVRSRPKGMKGTKCRAWLCQESCSSVQCGPFIRSRCGSVEREACDDECTSGSLLAPRLVAMVFTAQGGLVKVNLL